VRNLVSQIEGRTTARAFENRVLKKIFGFKRDKVGGDWRKCDSYSSPNL
jgi:hypothetical protein